VVALITVGCHPRSVDGHDRLMDQIETKVELPSGSLPMARYSRYYAWKAPGIVEARYTIHFDSFRRSVREACGETRYRGVFPCGKNGEVLLVGAGERLWLARTDDLPGMLGGGCAQITLTYDLKKNAAPQLRCNGPI
jgi:hypothetical protein